MNFYIIIKAQTGKMGVFMDAEKVGRFISKLRKKSDLTQEELAEKIGVNSKTVSKWETGINVPDTILLFQLSKVFNVSVQDILNGEVIENAAVNDSTIIEGITFYNKIFKKKIMKLFVSIILFLIIVFTTLYTISNYNKNQLFDIKTNDQDFAISGFLICNNQESIVVLNDITYQSDVISTNLEPKIKQYNISIKDLKQNITYFSLENEYEIYNKISDVFNSVNITFIVNNKDINILKNNMLNQLFFVMSYDNNGTQVEKEIKLEFDRHYSNNKIIY